ncbi:MAG: DUF4279 domain-containing protein [Gammaproteobacteria bacterium]
MASNKARAYFGLSGYHFNPDNITQLIGIEPTATNGSGMGGSLDKPAISSWELSTDIIIDDIDLYDLTDIITKQLEPVTDKILEAIKNYNVSPRFGVVLELTVEKNASNPDIGFGARTIRLLAELGAFINIEYKLSE